MFSKGEFVVKPNAGVCVIEDIISKRLSDTAEEKKYYCLAPVADSRARLFVPVASDMDKTRLRKAMSENEAWELIRSIPDIESRWIENDKYREQEYKDAVHSNDPRALVSIIKNLYIRNKTREENGKKVTAVDDRYFKLAENALYSEIAHALNRNIDELQQLISSILK